MQDCLLYGFSTFLPSILKAMNYSTLQANYLTIPVYMWGAISFLFLAWISDRISMRGPASHSSKSYGKAETDPDSRFCSSPIYSESLDIFCCLQ